jgi:hypothetical protein
MTASSGGPRLRAEAPRRRWRIALLLGLISLLALAGYALVVTEQSSQANRTVAVLRATKDITAGTVIHGDEIGVVDLRSNDQDLAAHLVPARDRQRLLGQMATQSVRAGDLLPPGLGASASTASFWAMPLPVRRIPAGLQTGDHVALLVGTTSQTGQPIDEVVMQDVQVLAVQPGSVTLWLPAKDVAQMEWHADHGGIVLAKMPAGAVQDNLPVGGGR